MVDPAKANAQEIMEVLKIKILTFNIHNGINWNSTYDLEGLIKFIREVNPDLIGLQEVGRNWSQINQFDDIPGILALRLGMFPIYSVALDRNGRYFGNLLLSRYPIVQSWSQTLPSELEQRSVALAQIDIQGIKVNFATTHLGLSVTDRIQQANAIQELLDQINGPLIVAGDFNAGIMDPAVMSFRENFLDLQEQTGMAGMGTFRLKNEKIGERIDYIFSSFDLQLNKIEVLDNLVSDHLPVVAEISLLINKDSEVTVESIAPEL